MLFGLILLVDDDPMVRRYLKSLLVSKGLRTVEASDGDEGLTIVHQLDGRLDAIVSDIQMPKRDGISLARAVKAEYPRVALILISGMEQPDSSDDLLFLRKPFLPAQFIEALECAIGSRVDYGSAEAAI